MKSPPPGASRALYSSCLWPRVVRFPFACELRLPVRAARWSLPASQPFDACVLPRSVGRCVRAALRVRDGANRHHGAPKFNARVAAEARCLLAVCHARCVSSTAVRLPLLSRPWQLPFTARASLLCCTARFPCSTLPLLFFLAVQPVCQRHRSRTLFTESIRPCQRTWNSCRPWSTA